ncbi:MULTISPECIES: TlpA disulfide reductase family protein [Gemmobacter]|jgi:thiol-disulfide isomerase/thioredoxin|uniref:Thiol-disulfide isomerase/thioredoxin n=2 Tax=Gemmobacter TaxID=204456 RepID=A0A2T6B6A1_9RHOB|nr:MULTISPECIES: TlpA disulfide reductase family protein [Gemmobacter]OJY33465.1 MAG: redoxin [Rhodobacterales bacterium 65-51]PTX51587.1 thiol-disulfide isomerase/thioredoxin [Gemmobacter caeni]TWJ03715.1 thiol-disulfide isomerase/thioredoxin [Gemmobacter caeni]GHC12993.1 thioredoxin [Gemmobacter nanjingensis]
MLPVRAAVLYTALLFGANPAAADIAAADALRDGDMKKLNFAEAQELPEIGLVGLDDSPRALSEFRGKWTVVNFWATWCPPCRHEMPSLGALQQVMGGPEFEVVTVATGRNAVPAIEEFFEEAGVTHLTALRDPKSALARNVGIAGLPVTLILNPEGEEVGRLIGDADWNSAEARAVLTALMR